MPQSEYPISSIISFAKNSQVNSTIAIQKQLIFNSGILNANYSRELYLVRKAVEFVYNANPTYSTLRQVAEFLYALSRPFIVNAATISITNPSNQSVNVGQNATFSVSVFVSNSAPYTIQWFRNSVAIPGATSTSYTLVNAQLSDSGAQFSAQATSVGVGTALSATATIAVTQAIVGYYYFGATDYSTQILAGTDTVPYVGTFPITLGQPLSISLPSAAANTYMVFKYPSTESIKTNYSNLPLNVGVIPNIAWENVVTFGGWRYIVTRTGNTFGLNYVNPLVFS